MKKNKESLDLAILLVNGKFNYKNHLWIELSIGHIIRNTSPYTSFKVFVWNHDVQNQSVSAYLGSVQEHVEVLNEKTIDLSRWRGVHVAGTENRSDYFSGGIHAHRGALQILYEYAVDKFDVEMVFTFDSDSWPIRANWEWPLVFSLRRDIRLAGVWRDELRAVIPPYIHSSGLGIRAETLRELGLRFDLEPVPPTEDTLSHFTREIQKRYGPQTILPLKRSNAREYHAVFNGVYGGLIYHHHLGTRFRAGKIKEPRTYGWEERGESLAGNKFILDATTQTVFTQADDFVDELAYGDDSFRYRIYAHFLRHDGSPAAYKRLYEEAWRARGRDGLESYYILGLIGRHFAKNADYLRLYAEVCEGLGKDFEAVSYRQLLPGRPAASPAAVCKVDDGENLGRGLKPGDRHYRAFVGPPGEYDLIAAMTFNLLTTIGLRQHHRLLDVGCGSLRIGRLLIPYLNAGNYSGIEPHEWLVREGIRRETGDDLVRIKKSRFFFADHAGVLPAGTTFDFAVAQSVFSHCTLESIGRWLSGLFPHLGPSGALLATFKEAASDFFHELGITAADFQGDGWIYPKCAGYRVETMKKIAEDAGYRFQVLDWRHPRQTWALFAREGFDMSWLAGRTPSWNSMIEALNKRKGPKDERE
jgi:SAM-dependent methyltransferase